LRRERGDRIEDQMEEIRRVVYNEKAKKEYPVLVKYQR
jgi:hypothetical protein